MKLAGRLSAIQASLTMQVMLEAQELRSQGIDIIDLGPGQPDFPTPAAAKEAGKEAIDSDFTRYTPSAGIPELRQVIADNCNRDWGTTFRTGNVIVCCGAKHAVFNVAMSILDPGDEILIPRPHWVTFPEVVRICGGYPSEVATDPKDGFVLTASRVAAQLSRKTRGLIINSPNNPTGAVIPAGELHEIVDLCRREGLFLLSDETYDRFTYQGTRHTSVAAYLGTPDSDFAIVGSCSKTYAMTGWRIGYCIGPAGLIEKMNDLQSHQTGNPASVSQKAALAALRQGPQIFEAMRVEYEQRRKLVLEKLSQVPGFSCAPPGGAFYVFPRVSEAMATVGCSDSASFAHFLLHKARVATVPGSAFGFEGHLRISFAAPAERLASGLDRIASSLASGSFR